MNDVSFDGTERFFSCDDKERLQQDCKKTEDLITRDQTINKKQLK